MLGVASQSKRPAVEGLGAVHVPKGEGWTDRVRALAPEGVDGVIDAVGGDVLRASIGLLRAPVSSGPGVLPVRSVADFGLVAELGGQRIGRRRTTAVFSRVAELVAAGHVTPVVSAAYPLAEAQEAVSAVEHHSPVGNVVVTA